jgi:small-conductance mechanosensitive channel/CRP-like cAMP-binding protein
MFYAPHRYNHGVLLSTTVADPVAPMFHAPEGWHAHEFWGNLALVAHQHRAAIGVGVAGLALLIVGRAMLSANERPRLRLALIFFTLYFVTLPLRAALLAADLEVHYDEAQLLGTVMLTWGIIGVAGLILFDFATRRLGVPKIIRDLSTIIAMVIALVVLLRQSGVNLLSIITTSAVLTAVIGLALQDTLGNLLSGVALQLEGSISIGDWIRVEDKPIGRVREIRWRSTVIQTKNGDLVIIPNGMMTKGVITNFNKDELENRRWVYFSVGLREPPNEVQRIVIEALRGVPNVSTVTPPDCIVWAFKESVIEYAVRYRLVDYLPDDPTDSEVRKRIWYSLARHGIEIPFPAHNVVVTQQEASRTRKSERELRVRMDALHKVTIFAPLDEPEREKLAHTLRHEVYGRGEVILRVGDPGDSLYVIRLGEVAVKIGHDGLEKEVARLRGGEFFGEMSLLTGAKRAATVVAVTDAECFVVDRAAFQEILQSKGSLAAEIATLLHARERALHGNQAELSAEAAARLAREQQDLFARIKSFFGVT